MTDDAGPWLFTVPKEGTIERKVFDLLKDAGPKGVCYFDAPEEWGLDEQGFKDVMMRIQYGLFETDEDQYMTHDA